MKMLSRLWLAMFLLFPVCSAFAGMLHRVDTDAFRPLTQPHAKGARLSVAVSLGEQPMSLELERFEVFNADAEIVVYGDNDKVIERLAPPAQQYYSGFLGHDPDSLVFVSVGANGRVEGLILTEKRRYEISSSPRSRVGSDAAGPREMDVFVMESPLDEDFSSLDGFTCDVEKTGRMMGKFGGLLKSLGGDMQSDGALSGSSNTYWQLNLALETDYELFVNAGSNVSNVNTFIGNLVAAASTIYKRDLKTELFVSHLGVHSTVSDPFTVVPGSAGTWDGVGVTWSTFHALLELGDRWHNTPPSANARSTAILISGKSQLAGIAWIETICQGDFSYSGHWGGAYAYCGGIDPPADNSVPNPEGLPNNAAPSSNYWPLLQFTHELGHNVGSNHTHCITLSAQDQATYGRTFVDQCYNGESTNPNVTCSGLPQTIPAEKGTIMSYCHLNGASQTRFIFGKTGEASSMMLPLMQGFISAYTPTLSVITAPASVNVGVATNASVTNAGHTYLWTITNGTINGSSTSSTVNFTATATPVTLKVRATNAGGCSVTDFATITATASCSYAIAPTSTRTNSRARTGQTINVTAGVGCNWTAVSNSAFITITGGASGSGNGTVTYSLSTNNTGVTRAGTMTIAGHTYTVTQTALAASAHTDFNADGLADLVWRSSISSTTSLWRMNGTTVAGTIALPEQPTNWSVGGIGDFNGDGTADLFWRSPSSNGASVSLLNADGTLIATTSLGAVASAWVVQGVGDFSGDGRTDILWRNSSSFAAVVWIMNGATITQSAVIAAPNGDWSINGVGDFNGDGKADILWRNSVTSAANIWLMNGAAILSAANVAYPNAIWTVKGVGDFNGDGMTDIFWVNTSNQTVVWLMNGMSILSSGYSATPPAGWAMQAAGDFNADGRADLFWRNTNTGQNALWFMNGIAVGSSAYIASQLDLNQNVVGPR